MASSGIGRSEFFNNQKLNPLPWETSLRLAHRLTTGFCRVWRFDVKTYGYIVHEGHGYKLTMVVTFQGFDRVGGKSSFCNLLIVCDLCTVVPILRDLEDCETLAKDSGEEILK
jgi:hypothetical protein